MMFCTKNKTVDASIKNCGKNIKISLKCSPEHFHYDKSKILQDRNQLVVELIDDADAAFEIVKTALEKKQWFQIKKLLQNISKELYELQKKKHQVPFLYEAAVCGSIPIIRKFRRILQ